MIHREVPVTVAIIGPVSAGKSTFLNGILGGTYSDMQRKKTTMLPQWYNVTNNKLTFSREQIYQKNTESNKQILEQRITNISFDEKFVIPLEYDISPIYDFLNLPDQAKCRILDMPGLNCGGGNAMYYKYIKNISNKIDIYILVFDINSCMNTTDEIEILKLVRDEINKNKHGHVIVLMNKCDNVEYNEKGFEINDDELKEMFDNCENTVNNYFLTDNKKRVKVLPFCASKIYLYRSVYNSIDRISEKNIDDLIITEAGKIKLSKLETFDEKKQFLQQLLDDNYPSLYNGWMNDTGYRFFSEKLNSIYVNNQVSIVLHYVSRVIVHVGDPSENYMTNVQKYIKIHNILTSLIFNDHCEFDRKKCLVLCLNPL